MTKTILLTSAAMIVAIPLQAQRAVAYEGGLLAHYTKADAASDLNNGAGLGLNLDVYLLKRLALEYSGDAASHKNTATNNDLTMVNHRFDLVYNQPLGGKWRGLIGGGWTGTRFNGDKTKNEYDSGVNALLGLRYCVNDNWSWKVEGVGDFKDPSDQAPPFTRTTTATLRFGITHFFGG
ncbi:MAG TPA: outer membrane beta-barrel protein, partial [Gemmatimonadaceae bacterium]|nr:outer membrane beta-barrel protein [Gemmatimonadaceae bacterium]